MATAKKMTDETIEDLNPRSSGARARLEAMRAHHKGYPLNQDGHEIPDSTPIAPPIGYKPQPSLFDQVRDMVTLHQRELAEAGGETLEEFEDLEIEDQDEYIPSSEYENDGDPSIAEIHAAVAEHRKSKGLHPGQKPVPGPEAAPGGDEPGPGPSLSQDDPD